MEASVRPPPLLPSRADEARAATRSSAHQEELRAEVSRCIDAETLKRFRTLNVSYTLKDAAVIYLLLAIAVGGVCTLHRLIGLYALCFVPAFALVAGIAFNWLNVQVHEASHGLLFADKKRNDRFCNLALGSLALQDVQSYRVTHNLHHAHLHTDRDPDLWVYSSRVGSWAAVLRGALDDLLLLTVLRRKRETSGLVANKTRNERGQRYAAVVKVLGQALVLGVFVAACGAWGVVYYLSVYFYGLAAIFPALVRVRTVVQHYNCPAATTEPKALFTARTTEAPLWQFIVVGARMDYHFEHHLYATIPYYNLATMHTALLKDGFFDRVRAQTGQKLHTNDYVGSFLELAT